MIEVSFKGRNSTQVKGIYRYDTGQKLKFVDVEIPDGADMDYYQGERNATEYVEDNIVSIPDKLLSLAVTIKAYVYVRNESSGKTKKEVVIPVVNRPRPGNSVEENEAGYRRLLPEGGEEGQVLRKKSGKNYDVEWGDAGVEAEGFITMEEIDRLFEVGKE